MTAQQKTKKQFIIKMSLGVLLTLSTIGFIFSDIQSFSFGNKNTLRTVGTLDITTQDLNRERQNMARMLGAIPQTPMIQQQIIEQAFENLTISSVLSDYTATQGILASENEIAQKINAISAFHDSNGNFDATILKKILQSQRISTAEFKNNVAQDIIRENFMSSIATEFPLSEKMALAFNRFAFEKINVTAYHIDYDKLPHNFQKITPLNDDILKGVYEKSKDTLYRPALKDIEYVVFDADNLNDKITISDAQITDFYNQNKDRLYTQAEKRKVLQIILDNQDKALQVYEKLKLSNDFVNTAKEYGFNPKDIDLGFITADDLTETTAQTKIFSAPKGTLLEPIKTDFGFAIYFIEQIQDTITKPLDTVKSEIKNTLMQKEATDYLSDIQLKIDDDLAGGASLKEITEKYGSLVKVQKNITADGFIYNPQILKNPMLEMARLTLPIPLADINDYNVGDDIPLIQGDNGSFIVLKITASTPQTQLTFEESKERLKNQEMQIQKSAILKQILQELHDSTNKTKLCLQYNIKRHDYTIQRNGNLPADIDLPKFNTIIFAKDNTFYVSDLNAETNQAIMLGVNKIIPADNLSEQDTGDFTQTLQKNYDSYIQSQALNMLKHTVSIETNETLLNDYLTQEIGR